jgi:hypothetical protein
LSDLGDLGDQLLAYASAVDFEKFLGELYNLSDDRTEFLINDRLSFMWFLGLVCPIGSLIRTPFGFSAARTSVLS